MNTLIIEADYIVTCNKENSILKEAALYIEKDRIKEIGPKRVIKKKYKVDKIIEGKNKILMPGLVNTHTHSVQTLLRGKADDLDLLDWLKNIILPGEKEFSAEEIYTSCLTGFAEMIRTGTTTCNDMLTTHNSDKGIKAAIDIGIRTRIGKMLMDTNDLDSEGMKQDTQKIISDVIEQIEKYHNTENNRIKYSLNARFLLSCSSKLMRELVKIREKYPDILIHTHASENKKETKLVKENYGESYIRVLDNLEILGENTILAHCIWLEDEEFEIIKNTNTKVSHNPSSNSKLASGISNILKFQKIDVGIGLATDGAPCNNNLDMFREMRLASFLQKVKHLNEKALPAKDVLRMATIEGAKILNLEKDIGSIEEGKKADIILVDLEDINAYPLYDPISHLVYSASGKDISMTIIDGKIVYEKGKFTTIDVEKLKQKIIEYQNKVKI